MLVVAGKHEYRILEIEFYQFIEKLHPDTFTHCDDMQRECGKWYFHRSGKSFRGGTYKGLDISFGRGKQGYGGVLLRSI